MYRLGVIHTLMVLMIFTAAEPETIGPLSPSQRLTALMGVVFMMTAVIWRWLTVAYNKWVSS